jgi:hypothetical protein
MLEWKTGIEIVDVYGRPPTPGGFGHDVTEEHHGLIESRGEGVFHRARGALACPGLREVCGKEAIDEGETDWELVRLGQGVTALDF